MNNTLPPKVLADGWYAHYKVSDFADSFEEILQKRCPSWLRKVAANCGTVRGALLFWYSRSYDAVVTIHSLKGGTEAMFLDSIFRRRSRRFVLLELLCSRPAGWKLLLHPLWHRLVLGPAIRRAVAFVQVMTPWERDHYSKVFRVPLERLKVIPWPLRYRSDVLPEKSPQDPPVVMSSGRVLCDWETLFSAAHGAPWKLMVVCSRRDLPRVHRLNRDGRAEILSELTADEHRERVKNASIYVVSLRESGCSAGQVRLSEAIRVGTPVVATDVKGLRGYVTDGETAVLYAEGEAVALRSAIDGLLADPQKMESLRRTAFERASDWTKEDYTPALQQFVKESVEATSGRSPQNIAGRESEA